MNWGITGDAEDVPGGADATAWSWTLKSEDGSKRTVILEISGTAMTASAVHFRVDKARQSRGLSEIAPLLEWKEPPGKITFHSESTVPDMEGGDPGPDLREIVEIVDWFSAFGIWLVFSGRSGGTGPGASSGSQTAHVIDPESDTLVGSFEAPTRLEAARNAQNWWVENIGPRKPALLLTGAETSAASLLLDVPNISTEQQEALDRREFQLVINGPGDDPNSGWVLEAYTKDGELQGLSVGEKADDAFLALFEDLFPDRA